MHTSASFFLKLKTHISTSFFFKLKLIYYVQDAEVEAALVRAIKPHVGALRNNMFGKRILSKTCLKSRKL